MNSRLSDSFRIWRMFSREQRRNACVMLFLMVVGVVLETAGIGLVIPMFALMTQGDLSARYPALGPFFRAIGNPSQTELVIYGMLTLVGIYCLKMVFLAFLAWRQASFVSQLQLDFSQRLFVGYLRQPYAFHLQRNSAQLIRNITGQVGEVINVVQQGLMLITEVLVISAIAVLLLTVEPLGAILVVCTLGVAGWGFNFVTRKHIVRWSEARLRHDGFRIQYLLEGLGGVKDVKLLGREQDFLTQYLRHSIGSARVSQRQSTLQALPRLWLEFLTIAGLAALVFVMIGQGKPHEALLPVLGLFAAAAFRLMPSVNRVVTAVQGVRFSLPVIGALGDEFDLIEGAEGHVGRTPLPFVSTLTLDHVVFRYDSAESAALNGISLSVRHGTSVGFIGGSGAGKSTLVDVILGLLKPGSGSVRVDGRDIADNLRAWQDQIGYVPQSIFLTDDTLRRNIAFGLPDAEIDDEAVRCAVMAAQLDKFAADLPLGLETVVGERGVRLSGGQRQRIGIARALYHDPSVLVLDEATSSLDTATETDVMDAIRALRGSKTILIVAHRLSTVEHCDWLFRLEGGIIAEAGRPDVLLRTIESTPSISPNPELPMAASLREPIGTANVRQ